MTNLAQIYKDAAQKAFDDGISAAQQDQLTAWIRENCSYRPDTEYFLVLGIGSELADLEAQHLGFKNEVDRAFTFASKKLEMVAQHGKTD